MLRISEVQRFEPALFTVLGWEVYDIDQKIDVLVGQDVVFEINEGLNQDELGIANFSDGIKIAWFKDADGNILSLTSSLLDGAGFN